MNSNGVKGKFYLNIKKKRSYDDVDVDLYIHYVHCTYT